MLAFNPYDSTMSDPVARISFAIRRASDAITATWRAIVTAPLRLPSRLAQSERPGRFVCGQVGTSCLPGARERGPGLTGERDLDAGVTQARAQVEQLTLGSPDLARVVDDQDAER